LNKLEYFIPQSNQVVRSVKLPSGGWHTVGVLDDGHIVGVRVQSSGAVQEGTQSSDSAIVRLWHQSHGTMDSIARTPWQVRYGARTPSGSLIEVVLPLEPTTAVVARGRNVFIGPARSWEIIRYSSTLGLDTLRLEGRPVPLTSEMVRQWQEERARLTDAPRAEFLQYLRGLPYPTQLPAYDSLVPDSAGNLVIREFPFPGSARANWRLVDPATNVTEVLELPIDEFITDLTAGRIVAVHSSIDAPQVVRVYRRPGLSPDYEK
jgi:hypothetical protein